MHISDGVLSAPVLIAGAAVAAAGTVVGLKKMDTDKIPKVAMLTSAFFVASLVHVPIGPVSVHLTLNGLVGILLGWSCFPAILVALLLQTLLFQFGGISVLGVNTVVMGAPALVVYFIFKNFIKKDNNILVVLSSFFTGALAVLLAVLLDAYALFFSGDEFINLARLLVLAHLPVMAIEGAINVFIIILLKKVKPEILKISHAVSQKI